MLDSLLGKVKQVTPSLRSMQRGRTCSFRSSTSANLYFSSFASFSVLILAFSCINQTHGFNFVQANGVYLNVWWDAWAWPAV